MNTDEVERKWNEFWKNIVCNSDESINIEQIKKELADYSFLLEQVPKVYCHITNSLLRKVNYKADTVIKVFEECQDELINKEMAKEDLLAILNGEISDNIKTEVEEYFE